MKLLACHIENFGKLSDFSMDFSEGLNVINESNAWGKSTLAAFLKVMFYGLDSKKDPKAFDKERNIYRPWQGGAFGGEVDFEIQGRRYRISRTFGRTEKTDEFHLYNLSTNLECFDYTENIGAEIFDLDSASFKRSIYIAQNDCSSETSDGINAKLGNLAENTDDINNFESASLRLKEILNQLTPDRVTGSIKKRKNFITQLTQEIRSYDSAKEGMQAVLEKDALVTSQIQEMMKIRKDYADALAVASEDSRRRELYAQYDRLCQETTAKENAVAAFGAIFPKGIPTEEEFLEQMKAVRGMEEAKATVRGFELSLEEHENWSKLEEMFEKEVPDESTIEFSLETLGAADKQKAEIAKQEAKLTYLETDLKAEVEEPRFEGPVHHLVFVVLGTILAVLGAVGFALLYFKVLPINLPGYTSYIMIGVAGLGVWMLLIGVILRLSAKKKRNTWLLYRDAEKSTLQAQYDALKETVSSMKEDVRKVNSTIGTFLGNFHVYCTVEDYQSKLYDLKGQIREYNRLKEKVEACADEERLYQKGKGKVVAFSQNYGFSLGKDYGASLAMLQNKATEYHIAKKSYEEIVGKKESFEKAQDKSFWAKTALCPYSIDELNQMISQADESLESLKQAHAQYEKQLENFQEQLDARDEKQEELEELQQQQMADVEKYELVKVTQEFLQRAKEQFTARYMAPISRGFSKYYQMLTGDKSGNWTIDANINLKLREHGELRETKWLSAGYQDLIGVCMRLALVDAMYEEEKPFLILDDPFVNLDQQKVTSGNELLHSVAEEYQVIYFTCHDSRNPL